MIRIPAASPRAARASGTRPTASRSSIRRKPRKCSSCTWARRTAGAWPTWTAARIRRIVKDLWYGHTTGKWEGDTLVMDTVGFNDRFWVTREGVPTTKQLHLIEKLSRPDHDRLKYEATVDDPGAYTAPWSRRS